MNCLAIIPARGGSKGIPRKNLRPICGKPLLYYSITSCLASSYIKKTVVSTDDEEIALFAQRFGANVLLRPKGLANDVATLDSVVSYVVQQAEEEFAESYDFVVTVQPTSPLVLPSDIDRALEMFVEDSSLHTVLSVVDDRHLCWTINDNNPQPLYEERVNRQQLPPAFKETGAVIACARGQLTKGTRIGEKVALLEMPIERSFDIDEITDFYLCESILKRKSIVFNVVGYPEVGLGHAYRAVMLANEMVNYQITFVCEEKSRLAAEYVKAHNYNVIICENGCSVDAIRDARPDLVINDILDTQKEFIEKIKSPGVKVVNFEDLGDGSFCADLVVNALYPHQKPSQNILTGHEYFCLRDEFLFVPKNIKNEDLSRILVAFGGVDEGNLTARVISLIAPWCKKMNVIIDAVLGPGFTHINELEKIVEEYGEDVINVVSKTSRISDYMCSAGMAITSGGRTVLELAALKVPTIVICQNVRETSHTFANFDNGIINLGFREEVSDKKILQAIKSVATDKDMRRLMCSKLEKMNLVSGKQKVVSKIKSLLS